MLKYYKEESPLATELKRVFSRLQAAQKIHDIKTIMVTSSILGEGKSTVSSLLATVCSQYRNTKTLLIDMDLRRPKLHEIFEIERARGVTDIILKQKSVKTCLKSTSSKNLFVVTSGVINCSPSEILNNVRLKDMFLECKFYFDLIIIDTPPVVPVSDTMLLSSEVDGALFLIKAGKTQKPVIKRAIQLLQEANIKILGVIVNNMHHVLPYYYDYKYYRYEYYNYKKDDTFNDNKLIY